MRIREDLPIGGIKKKTSEVKKPLRKETVSLFANQLEQQTTESYEQEIEELRKEIEQAGEKLQKEPTLANFRDFRDRLSRLAKRITTEAYQLEKIGGTPQNPRYYEIITVINAEADRLYNLIVRENKDHLAITAKVIGIKGMVVDLIT